MVRPRILWQVARPVLGAVIGALAVLVGAGWIFGSIRRQVRHAENAPTYAAMGGPVYTVFQIGCGGLLVLGGAIIIVVTLVGASR
jgi:hypothetical protein